MNKKIFCVLCAAFLLIGTACAITPLEDSYWKAVEIRSGGESIVDEFWADIFLWKGGATYFRFSQATVESDYYGMREVFDCDWSFENGKLALNDTAQSGDSPVIHTGVIEQNRLIITYKSYYLHENVRVTMERAPMPPYGAQWEMPELFGTWRMVSYSDKGKTVSTEKLDRRFNSELAINPTLIAEFLLDDQEQYTELDTELHVKYREGPLWDGCVNQAWHVELAGDFPTGKKYYAAYSGSRLLFMRKDIDYPGVLETSLRDTGYPLNFTAEFELIGMYIPLSETQGFFSPRTPDCGEE